ncbi:spermidine/putrescine ABC transporter ATP-binding protein [Bacillus wiedmannii]|uniref:Spermidine/putrescine ABC transporter ATP-binding protein n=2 Tax=Bacillus wiedmannii TaxID=1890302 RepID=A0A2A8BU52_9BACI|nr:spermidine/putrescine ABC transporter ATP-binding protein [Bacillus sp. BPN334]PEM58431.1 spermidine/putrescine ABC transporter ATP-binding protein [Bacillus wiedmannii]PEO36714.1 spermidine/putrescine ABC transporter ATP-binding protein [Bacillus wiedmannii]PGA93360.1 spermidine/putrescine ABC transporter ATP-binding protein [Bacillus wiedmannii]
MYNRDTRLFYPALTGSKIPAQNSAKAKKLGGRLTARKSPIGSTNNPWEMKKTPTD